MGISAGTALPPSMIIHELDVVGVPVAPDETDAPLLVDANGMLSAPLAAERLKPVARRRAQVVEPRNRIEQKQLSDGTLGDVSRYALRRHSGRQVSGAFV